MERMSLLDLIPSKSSVLLLAGALFFSSGAYAIDNYYDQLEQETLEQIQSGDLNSPIVREGLASALGLEEIIANPEKRDLFRLDNLLSVDYSQKQVQVQITPEVIQTLGEDWETVIGKVFKTYYQMGITLELQVVKQIDHASLKPGERVAIEALTETESETKYQDIIAFAQIQKSRISLPKDLPLRTLNSQLTRMTDLITAYQEKLRQHKEDPEIAKTKTYQDDLKKIDTELKRLEKTSNSDRMSVVLIHELGHLFGLAHSTYFVDDHIPNLVDDQPNCMKAIRTYSDPTQGCTITELQRRIMHSFVSKGQVYQAHQAVEFSPFKYNLLVGDVNRFTFSEEASNEVRRILN